MGNDVFDLSLSNEIDTFSLLDGILFIYFFFRVGDWEKKNRWFFVGVFLEELIVGGFF